MKKERGNRTKQNNDEMNTSDDDNDDDSDRQQLQLQLQPLHSST